MPAVASPQFGSAPGQAPQSALQVLMQITPTDSGDRRRVFGVLLRSLVNEGKRQK